MMYLVTKQPPYLARLYHACKASSIGSIVVSLAMMKAPAERDGALFLKARGQPRVPARPGWPRQRERGALLCCALLCRRVVDPDPGCSGRAGS
jgi:hypothetical protein